MIETKTKKSPLLKVVKLESIIKNDEENEKIGSVLG